MDFLIANVAFAKSIRNIILSVSLVLPSLAYGADNFAACHFTTECFESESCTDTDFSFAVNHNGGVGFIIQTDAENIDGLVFDNRFPEETSTLIGQTETAYHMLTIQPDGTARYSLHMQGPMVVSYMGACDVEEVITN